MFRKLILVGSLFSLAACSGCGDGGLALPGDAGTDAQACVVLPIATTTCTDQPLPLNQFPQPMNASALTVYLDGTPLPPSAWTLTNGGHTLTLGPVACTTAGQHIVSASLGCSVQHAACSPSYGCR